MANQHRPPQGDPHGILKERIGPGVWVDQAGALHWSIPELLTHFGWPDDAEHRQWVERVIKEKVLEQWPGTRIVDSQ